MLRKLLLFALCMIAGTGSAWALAGPYGDTTVYPAGTAAKAQQGIRVSGYGATRYGVAQVGISRSTIGIMARKAMGGPVQIAVGVALVGLDIYFNSDTEVFEKSAPGEEWDGQPWAAYRGYCATVAGGPSCPGYLQPYATPEAAAAAVDAAQPQVWDFGSCQRNWQWTSEWGSPPSTRTGYYHKGTCSNNSAGGTAGVQAYTEEIAPPPDAGQPILTPMTDVEFADEVCSNVYSAGCLELLRNLATDTVTRGTWRDADSAWPELKAEAAARDAAVEAVENGTATPEQEALVDSMTQDQPDPQTDPETGGSVTVNVEFPDEMDVTRKCQPEIGDQCDELPFEEPEEITEYEPLEESIEGLATPGLPYGSEEPSGLGGVTSWTGAGGGSCQSTPLTIRGTTMDVNMCPHWALMRPVFAWILNVFTAFGVAFIWLGALMGKP